MWVGIAAPKSTPGTIAEAVAEDVARALRDPDTRAALEAAGAYAAAESRSAFLGFVATERKRWSAATRAAGIRFD